MRGTLLLLLLTSAFLQAQQPLLYFETISVQDGLSHAKVNCILQDRRGFIWLGTDDGLNRYDGKHFVHFRHRPNDTTSISGNIISHLLEDKEGRIWIATLDGGLSRYDFRLPPAQQFRQYKYHPRESASIPVNTIIKLIEDRQGNLWLGTSGRSVIRFNKKTESFDIIKQSTRTILDLCQDNQGWIWVGRQGGGIQKINPYTQAVVEDPRYKDLYAKLPHVTVTALFKDKDNRMWFGSWDKVLYRQSLTSTQKDIFQEGRPYSFQNDEVISFAEDQWGNLWIGGRTKGLQLYDKQANRFYHYRHDASKEGTIADNTINCIFVDKQGSVWLGTNSGVNINNPDKQQFAQQFLQAKPNTPVTLYDFFENTNGQIWMGTSEGLYIKHPDGSLEHRPITYKDTPLHVTSFFRDENGTYYLGTNYSVFQYDPKRHNMHLLPNTEKDGVMNRIIESRVVSMIKTKIDGSPVLLTSPYGHYLTYYDLQRKAWVSRLNSHNIIERFNLKDNLIRKLYKAKDGTIWMATAKEGLGLWPHNNGSKVNYLNHQPTTPYSLANNNVFDLAEDNKGNFWISTYGGGLHYLDVKQKKFQQVAATNNLIEGLAIDDDQNVWMISNGNLHRYSPETNSYTSFALPDLHKTGGVKGKIFKDSKGQLYLAGNNYFISFNPKAVRTTQSEPQVYLTDFQIFNKSFSHLLYKDAIRLKYKDNYFAFEFAAPHFSRSNTVQYAYMMEGLDKDWIYAGERNYASYPNLNSGQYLFKVRATTERGSWNDDYAAVKLIITPPFWQRVWFYLLCIWVLGAAAYIIYRYRINEIVKRQAIRNKIAQDLHDNVGSTLSSISVYSQVAKIYQDQNRTEELSNTLEKIRLTSGEMITELNDTVWAINPRNDHMNVILQRMESFAQPLLAAQGIQFAMHYDAGVPHLNIDMEKRKNLFLIFKEVINNVVKYANCKTLSIELLHRGNWLTMKIKDDGKGFEFSAIEDRLQPNHMKGGGNGLKNMQQRAEDMKGSLAIYSAPGQGTMVELRFPLT